MAERKASDGKVFQKIIVWQQSHKLVLLAYKLSDGFPQKELFGLTNQLRRAVVSVAENIAEGYASGGEGQFKRFLNVAQGSLAEVEYFLILTRDLNYISSYFSFDACDTSDIFESFGAFGSYGSPGSLV